MTPLHIEIVLHYGTRTNDYREGDFSAPAVREAINAFKDQIGLLEIDPEASGRTYRLTTRGKAYMEALQRLPLPTCVWMIPTQPSQTFDSLK